jgi:hypothetical protein
MHLPQGVQQRQRLHRFQQQHVRMQLDRSGQDLRERLLLPLRLTDYTPPQLRLTTPPVSLQVQ